MGSASLVGRSILIVEDEPLVALDLLKALTGCGAKVLAATTLNKALAYANAADLSAATIDLKLHNARSYPVCRRLKERGIPFLFYTGYAEEALKEYADVPWLVKPTPTERVVENLLGLLHDRTAA